MTLVPLVPHIQSISKSPWFYLHNLPRFQRLLTSAPLSWAQVSPFCILMIASAPPPPTVWCKPSTQSDYLKSTSDQVSLQLRALQYLLSQAKSESSRHDILWAAPTCTQQDFSPGSTPLQWSASMNKPESFCPRAFAHAIFPLSERL